MYLKEAHSKLTKGMEAAGRRHQGSREKAH